MKTKLALLKFLFISIFFLADTGISYSQFSNVFPYSKLWANGFQWAGNDQAEIVDMKYSPNGQMNIVFNYYENYPLPFNFNDPLLLNGGSIRLQSFYPDSGYTSNREINIDGSVMNEAKDFFFEPNGEAFLLGNNVGNNWDTSYPYPVNNISTYQILFAKLNAQKKVLWHRLYGGSKNDKAIAMQKTADGNILILGSTDSPNDGDVTGWQGQTDIFLLKVNAANGNIIWRKCFGGTKNDVPKALKLTANGDIMISGNTNSSSFVACGANNFYSAFLMKLTSSGNLIWKYCWGGAANNDYGARFTLDSNENAYLTGTSYSKSTDAADPSNILVSKVNPAGQEIWNKTYQTPGKDSAWDIFYYSCENSLILLYHTDYQVRTAGIPNYASFYGVEEIINLNGDSIFHNIDRRPLFNVDNSTTLLAARITDNGNKGFFALGNTHCYFSIGGGRTSRSFYFMEVGVKLKKVFVDTTICKGAFYNGISYVNSTTFSDTLRDACKRDTLIKSVKITILDTGSAIIDSFLTVCKGSAFRNVVINHDTLITDTTILTISCGIFAQFKKYHIRSAAPTVVFLGNDTSICKGTFITLGNPVAGGSYLWNDGRRDSVRQASLPGLYVLSVTDRNGCSGRDSIVLGNVSEPAITITGNQSICKGDTTIISITGGIKYLWTSTPDLSCDTCSKVRVYPLSGKLYKLSVSNNCRIVDTVVMVQVNEIKLSISTPADEIFLGEQVDLAASSNGSVLWNSDQSLSCTLCTSPTASPVKSTTYYAHANLSGCEATDSITIKVSKDIYLYIPTSFTPNGDLLNDYFRIKTNLTKGFSFKIFNRLGNLVFASSDPNRKWDGKRDGIIQDTGAFTYIFSALGIRNTLIQRKGTILLIR